jgi:hypothetical protein
MGRHCCRRRGRVALGREPPSEPGTKRMICTTCISHPNPHDVLILGLYGGSLAGS